MNIQQNALFSGFTLIATLLFSACADDSRDPLTGNPGGGEKETFPCEGPWCFDPENNPTAKELFERYEEMIEPELFEIYVESYSACRYEEQDSGVVVVTCPDWLEPGIARCPQNWFQFLTSVGEVRAPELGPNGIYCFPDTDQAKAYSGSFLCADGYVNPGHAASDFDARLKGEGSGARCLSPEDCATLEALRWPSQERSCFYSDFSHISEGPPEEVDCATLAEGECSINCACPEQPIENQHLLRSSCNFVSPRQAVGVCSFTSCTNDETCNVPGLSHGQCLHQTNLPDWALRYQEGLEEKQGWPTSWGVCVEQEHFDNWRNNDNPDYRYGDE